jgi:hypothetical protein
VPTDEETFREFEEVFVESGLDEVIGRLEQIGQTDKTLSVNGVIAAGWASALLRSERERLRRNHFTDAPAPGGETERSGE